MRSKWTFLFLAALVGLSGQRADAMRTPLADVRAAITQPQQITQEANSVTSRQSEKRQV
jgi:hypothetical protein